MPVCMHGGAVNARGGAVNGLLDHEKLQEIGFTAWAVGRSGKESGSQCFGRTGGKCTEGALRGRLVMGDGGGLG
jgi:hypothetical protein